MTAQLAKTLETRPQHTPHTGPGAAELDVQRVRSVFPIVDQKVSGKPLIALDRVHPHDIGSILDRQGVALRAGHHCAKPLLNRLGVSSAARVSLGGYSTRQDIDALMAGLEKVNEAFR